MRFFGILLTVAIFVPTLVEAEEGTGSRPESAIQKKQLEFDGQKLQLAWQGEEAGDTLKEYLPAGQDLETWTKLASIREYPELNDPRAFAEHMARMINEKNPQSDARLSDKAKSGEAMITFLMWPE